ncbi:GTPase [Flavobacteriaceae bacterium R38]|nr:GTPase [Flavobacteriaceae bacterium R38]
MKSKLIFIYNANSGKLNEYLDIAHKIISPKTYQCHLCDITHGTFKVRPAWKKFREETDIAMEFLHIDEYESKYKSKFQHAFTYPIILIQEDSDLQVFMSTEEINKLETVEELMGVIEVRAEEINIS